MITINPPVVMPYAPAAQPIAFAAPMLMRDEVNGNRLTVQFWLLDVNKNRISFFADALPAKVITPAQLAAFASMPAVAGDSFDQDLARRALPILQANFGLTGTVQ